MRNQEREGGPHHRNVHNERGTDSAHHKESGSLLSEHLANITGGCLPRLQDSHRGRVPYARAACASIPLADLNR